MIGLKSSNQDNKKPEAEAPVQTADKLFTLLRMNEAAKAAIELIATYGAA